MKAGLVLGMLMRSHLDARPVYADDGQYTDEIILLIEEEPGEPVEIRLKVLP